MGGGQEAIDRDLAFGLVAVSRGLVAHRALAEALAGREADPSRSLRDLLITGGSLAAGLGDEVEDQVDGMVAGLKAADPRINGRFRVLRPYARGGLGEVFVAEDAELHREVALKEIQAHQADHPDSRARFIVEAEITGGLEHPGIVPVYSLGRYDDGRPYYAMRLVKGQTLLEAIRKFHEPDTPIAGAPRARRRELRRLLSRFVAVCEAIAYAHSRRVVHRDLKPRNILLGRFGETLVVDWGSAKAMDDLDPDSTARDERPIRPASGGGIEATIEGRTVGTPAYMPPEQAGARPEATAPAPAPAADIFGLGATLYHLLTGRAPFEADSADAALRLARRCAFPPPRAVKPEVPEALEAVCLRAMARAPEDRYGSALALAEDVEHWLGDEPVLARRESPGARIARWGRRNQSRAFSVAAGLLLLASTVAAFSYRQKVRALHELRHLEAVETADRIENERLEAGRAVEEAERRARIRDYYSRLDRAREGRSSNRPGWTARALVDLAAAARLDDGSGDPKACRDEAIAALANVDLRRTRALDPGIDSTVAPTIAVSPDGRRVVAFRHRPWAHRDYTGQVFDLATGSMTRTIHFRARRSSLFRSPEEVCDAGFSPDGRLLAVATSDGRAYLWDLDRPDPASIFWDASEQRLDSIGFGTDSRSIYTASVDGLLRRWRLGEDPVAARPSEAASWPISPHARCSRPAGVADLFTVLGRSLVRHDPVTLRDLGSVDIAAVSDEPLHTCPSPDGRSLAFVNGGVVGLLPLDGGPARVLDRGRIAPRSAGIHYVLRFSPDGSLLLAYFSDYDGDRRGLKLWEVGSGQLACDQVVRGIDRVGAAFTADGRHLLVVEDRKLVEYEIGGLDVQPRLAHTTAPLRAIALSPDGSTLAGLVRRSTAEGRERVEATLWRLPQGARSAERSGPDGPKLDDPTLRHSLAFDLAGRRLAVGTGGSPLHFWGLDDPARPWSTVETGGTHPVLAFAEGGGRLWGIMGRKGASDRVIVVDPDRPSVEDRWADDYSKFFTGLHGLNDLAVAGSLAVVAAHDGDLYLFRDGDPPGTTPTLWTDPSTLARDPAQAVALSPDGSRAAIGTQSGRLVLRPVPEGRPARTRDAHRGRVTALAFTRDGQVLATGAADRVIHLWAADRDDLRAVASLPVTEAPVVALAFSPDGGRLYVLLEGEYEVRAWDLRHLRDRLAAMGIRW